MLEFISYFFSGVWNHRRNRFIAVGGLAVFSIGLMFVLAKIQGVPDWLLRASAALTGTLIIVTMALACYYLVKFMIGGMARTSRSVIARRKGEGQHRLHHEDLG
jgi:hypothetical protein